MNKFKTLKDHVYDYIAEQIALGELQPQAKINENSICEVLSISRTPVREALIQLASEGILDNVPRRGFLVKSLNQREAEELYVIVGNLEGLAATLAYPNLTEREFRDMQFYIHSMNLAIDTRNYEMYLKQQKAFHQIFIDKCGNSMLIDYLEKMMNLFLQQTYAEDQDANIQQVLRETNQEHQQILELLMAGKTDEVREYLAKVHWAPENAHFDLMAN